MTEVPTGMLTMLKHAITGYMNSERITLEQATRKTEASFGPSGPPAAFADVVRELRDRSEQYFDLPDVSQGEYGQIDRWYIPPEEPGPNWQRFADRMTGAGREGLLDSLMETADATVTLCANPAVSGSARKGLVVGNVQSGKTANYTAVIARAVDAGYRFIIVLAGIHNNLRSQTQRRLTKDIAGSDWFTLTTDDADFSNPTFQADAALKRRGIVVAVVKKNVAPLRKMIRWFGAAPESLRANCPTLLLDDEADQATPSSARRAEEITEINRQVRRLWQTIRTGTYLAYTATPFANVFMDPDDEEDLFPSDFVKVLTPGDGYFGARRVFGLAGSEEDAASEAVDMVRVIPLEDAASLRPPSNKTLRNEFDPEVPPSLHEAVVWFLLATAARRARGQVTHSSMLVHVTHYASPHFALRDAISTVLDQLRTQVDDGDVTARLEQLWERESGRAIDVATLPLPDWEDVLHELPVVLTDVRVVVDNGSSEDRLDYGRVDEFGDPVTETIIAVGGGTLSRGLTLEGLVVSYFTRTTTMYDTLLQMGRWFGYRPGYEDLPRIWAQQELIEDFQFLALVEDDLRTEIETLASSGYSPAQLGVRVRAHPGRLEITSKNKMRHAKEVQVSLSGRRQQTFILDDDPSVIDANWQALEDLLARIDVLEPIDWQPSRLITRGVSGPEVIKFLENYSFHADQSLFDVELMNRWIRRAAHGDQWNVVVMGNSRSVGGDGVTALGDKEIAGRSVPLVNRAPMADSRPGRINIKALMSTPDRVADIDPSSYERRNGTDTEYRRIRAVHAAHTGLLLAYPISGSSTPVARPEAADGRQLGSGTSVRVPMPAGTDHILGIGVVFPETPEAGRDEGDFVSVRRTWDVPSGDDEDDLQDSE